MANTDAQGRTLIAPESNTSPLWMIETTLPNDSAYIIPTMNGRQGDANRSIATMLTYNNIPLQLRNRQVVVKGRDAEDAIKIVNASNLITDPDRGRVTLVFPAEMYQAVGAYKEAWIEVDEGDQVISSTNLHFEVFENTVVFTAGASQSYIDSVQKLIDEANKRIGVLNANIDDYNKLVTAAKTVEQQLLDALADTNAKTSQAIKDGKVALLNETNNFIADQNIEGVSFKDVVNRLATVEGNVLSDTGEVPLALSSDFTGNLRCRKITLKNPGLTLYIMSGQVTNSKALTAYNWVNLSEQQSSIIPEWDYVSARTDGGVSMTSAFNGSAFIINTGLEVPAGTNIQWNTISV